jgi:hypothetical protein
MQFALRGERRGKNTSPLSSDAFGQWCMRTVSTSAAEQGRGLPRGGWEGAHRLRQPPLYACMPDGASTAAASPTCLTTLDSGRRDGRAGPRRRGGRAGMSRCMRHRAGGSIPHRGAPLLQRQGRWVAEVSSQCWVELVPASLSGGVDRTAVGRGSLWRAKSDRARQEAAPASGAGCEQEAAPAAQPSLLFSPVEAGPPGGTRATVRARAGQRRNRTWRWGRRGTQERRLDLVPPPHLPRLSRRVN